MRKLSHLLAQLRPYGSWWLAVTLSYALLAAGVNLVHPAFWERIVSGELGALLASVDIGTPALAAAGALALQRWMTGRTRHATWRASLVAAVITLCGMFVVAPVQISAATAVQRWRAGMAHVLVSAGCFAVLAVMVVGRMVAPPWLLGFGYACFLINAWVALASLLPHADGALIWRWNRRRYLVVLALSILLALILSNEQVLAWLLVQVQPYV